MLCTKPMPAVHNPEPLQHNDALSHTEARGVTCVFALSPSPSFMGRKRAGELLLNT